MKAVLIALYVILLILLWATVFFVAQLIQRANMYTAWWALYLSIAIAAVMTPVCVYRIVSEVRG